MMNNLNPDMLNNFKGCKTVDETAQLINSIGIEAAPEHVQMIYDFINGNAPDNNNDEWFNLFMQICG